jgi:hypothetical protein
MIPWHIQLVCVGIAVALTALIALALSKRERKERERQNEAFWVELCALRAKRHCLPCPYRSPYGRNSITS